MSLLFGGEYWPIGTTVGFAELPYEQAVEATKAWPREERYTFTRLDGEPIRKRLRRLLPLQTPSKRELLVPVGDRWTAHLTNTHQGGDSFSWVGYTSGVSDRRGVVATHSPPDQGPFPATQFHLFGPTGERPLRYVRTIDAGIFDSGRWHFAVSGVEQPFEELDAYDARLKRDRFTRPMLLRYLAALGIDADNEDAFESGGMILESLSDYSSRTSTLEEFRAGIEA